MSEKKSLRAQVLDLAVGESLSISLDSYGYTTIRSYASELGFAENKTFCTRRNRTERTYTITRIR